MYNFTENAWDIYPWYEFEMLTIYYCSHISHISISNLFE